MRLPSHDHVMIISMLLIIAGDVETNPGPAKLTLQNLDRALQKLTEPIPFGIKLGIPDTEMTIIERDHRNGKDLLIHVYLIHYHFVHCRCEKTEI